MDQVPFCQRNVRLWVGLLVGAGVLVLGFAIWLAFERSAFDGSHHITAALGLGDPHSGGHPAPALAPAPAVTAATAATPGTSASAPKPDPGRQVALGLPANGAGLQAAQTGTSPALQLQFSFNRAADRIRPSVVNINAVRPSLPRGANVARGPRFIDPFDGVPDKVFGKLAYESVGSGVIVDPAGYIVTNYHLVGQATAIMVTRYNHANEHLPARLIASDSRRDLALIKLEREGSYPAASFTNSTKVEVGDWVLAVGNPFGLGHTVTSGIISGRRSTLVIGGVEYRGLIQTDAPINQGSSGGPLVNLQGEVVGINTAIYAPTGVFNGTGFAIPSNRVSAFVARSLQRAPALAAAGRLAPAGQAGLAFGAPPRLGLQVMQVTPALAMKLSMPRAGGVFVTAVIVNSPADEAEVRSGDVILAFAGVPVATAQTLTQVSSSFPRGAKLELVIWRKGKTKTLKLKT